MEAAERSQSTKGPLRSKRKEGPTKATKINPDPTPGRTIDLTQGPILDHHRETTQGNSFRIGSLTIGEMTTDRLTLEADTSLTEGTSLDHSSDPKAPDVTTEATQIDLATLATMVTAGEREVSPAGHLTTETHMCATTTLVTGLKSTAQVKDTDVTCPPMTTATREETPGREGTSEIATTLTNMSPNTPGTNQCPKGPLRPDRNNGADRAAEIVHLPPKDLEIGTATVGVTQVPTTSISTAETTVTKSIRGSLDAMF